MDGLFSTKSDVWSFGIFMYEVASYGSEPYAELIDGPKLCDKVCSLAVL